ncbi:GNAT family N-acetyltransferase [Saccharolobus islandicus]|uniref:N-acetyltransferase domain-containing protein n=3 Tax=Saccharolobus islandicus TaxID=43080 RepID=M9U6Y4_SACIS|nr:GNAT family N-acetyltransferase [Sulfolobus islandicus]ADX82748.1 conserved plasmid protein [Sulfolobus islandicus HVE10/4]ADX85388.1 conserved plasmid protein [Sulfolobus islandicus REY15A]AGJ62759.1 Hypothetical Protein SiL_1310 [Sulfolobus islandicus LAL14/1]WCM38440.1 GNAT family N-acetyltransferase [Sulfolobus islandicus]
MNELSRSVLFSSLPSFISSLETTMILMTILLGQLGIDKKYQGKGMGKALVRSFVIPYSLGYCIRNSCIGILVYTKTSKEFYEKLGFQLIYEDESGGANYFYSLYKNVLEVRYRAFLA